jgi:hypothetical protein
LDSGASQPLRAKPIFLPPKQEAREHYLSWWHVPIELDRGDEAKGAKIEHCTVEVNVTYGMNMPDPISLRWRSGDDPRGTEESTLIEGRTRMIPVVIRCERDAEASAEHVSIADGVARLNSAAYLRDGNVNQHQLSGNICLLKLTIHSGSKSWDSPSYTLRLPEAKHSNGRFLLAV